MDAESIVAFVVAGVAAAFGVTIMACVFVVALIGAGA